MLNTNEEWAYYIPLKQSIRTMLQNETLKSITDNINSFSNYVAKDKDLILSNRQGCCIKSNLSRRENSNVLLLKSYTDGICVTNPIGAKRDFHKCYEARGFQKTFSSGSFCRHSFITYEQRLIPLTDISFVSRTKLKHDMVLSQIIENNDDKIIQEVKCCSWFKNSVGFHPTESLPPDLMHDVAEGLCPLIITALLKEAIQQRILPYAQIEERTSSFNFGFNDLSNEPPPIKKQRSNATLASPTLY
ncbi:unnamed protein product [Rotaria magnacalcarata]